MKNIIFIIIIMIFGIVSDIIAQSSLNCNFQEKKEVKNGAVTVGTYEIDETLMTTASPYITPSTSTQERNIMWIHGLGGTEYAWSGPMVATDWGLQDGTFPRRNTHSQTTHYTTGGIPMRNCAYNVINFMKGNVVQGQIEADYKDNMLIAHSQGCIVARTMNMEAESKPDIRYFGGIAFFTGPNNGAEILRNARSVNDGGTGLGALLASNACNALVKSPIKKRIASLPGLKRLIGGPILDAVATTACDSELGKTVFQFAIDGHAKQAQTKAYLPNAPFLDSLKSFETNPNREFKPHRVNFISQEDDEGYLVWRTLQYQISPSSAEESFTANEDSGPGTLKSFADSLVMFVYPKEIESLKIGYEVNLCDNWWKYINNPWQWWKTGICRTLLDAIYAYEDGIEFFETVNDQWKVIIGAKHGKLECEIQIVQEDVDQNDNPIQNSYIEYYPDIVSQQGCIDKAQEIAGWPDIISAEADFGFNGDWVEEPSDGIVLCRSQQELPGQTMMPQQLHGSSHMQIRNDRNTKTALKKLFNNEIVEYVWEQPSGDWFATPVR